MLYNIHFIRFLRYILFLWPILCYRVVVYMFCLEPYLSCFVEDNEEKQHFAIMGQYANNEFKCFGTGEYYPVHILQKLPCGDHRISTAYRRNLLQRKLYFVLILNIF